MFLLHSFCSIEARFWNYLGLVSLRMREMGIQVVILSRFFSLWFGFFHPKMTNSDYSQFRTMALELSTASQH